MSEYPFVSVIVISYNGSDVIRDCLTTLLANDYPNFELVVVDNGSTDTTAEIVSKEFPQVRMVQLTPNRGYAGGMNQGLLTAKGEILIPFNDDTQSTPNLIREMVRPLMDDPQVGIVGCKIYYPDRKTLQHAGGIILPNGLTRHIGYQEVDQGLYDEEKDVDYVTGCAIAIRRKVIEELGLYDDRYYPTYFEEVEYAVRTRRAGYRVVYNPRAVLYHFESKTEVRFSPRFLYRYNKSRLRFVLKNISLRQLPQAFRCEFKWWTTLELKEYFLPLFRAYLAILIRLPIILYDRKHRIIPFKTEST